MGSHPLLSVSTASLAVSLAETTRASPARTTGRSVSSPASDSPLYLQHARVIKSKKKSKSDHIIPLTKKKNQANRKSDQICGYLAGERGVVLDEGSRKGKT